MFLLIISLLILSCNKSEEETEIKDCIEVEYNTTFSAILNDEVCFPDGSGFTVKTITDEFCPCEVVCVWEGELEVMVETTDINGDKELFTFGSSSFDLMPQILPNARIETFNFEYEGGELPDCQNEYDVSKVTLNLKIIEL